MGTGRNFQRSSSRLRIVVVSSVVALFVLYTLLPRSFTRDAVPSRGPDLGAAGAVQYPFAKKGVKAGDPLRARAVRDAMQETFWKYKQVAWGLDEVRPISGGSRNSRNGWAATLVDTMTTTLIMGLEEEFLLELNYTLHKINFSKSTELVDPFETTIRYLGALVSTVDMLDANFTQLTKKVSTADRNALLAQAVRLADKLAPGFDSPHGMIWPRINFTDGTGCREIESERPYPDYEHATIGPARAGSNWLENMALSRLSGLHIYGNNATRAWRPLVYNENHEEWPGIIDGPWDIMIGKPFDHHRSWGAGHDSYYEYLIKAHIMIPSDPDSAKYRDRWIQAVTSTREHLIQPSSNTDRDAPPQYFLHQWRNGWLINEMGHLACFAGGNWILGGKYLGKKEIVEMGIELVKTCRDTYAKTTTGIGPEYWGWYPSEDDAVYAPTTEGQFKQVKEWGWWVTDAKWILRPETVESYFYAYRITGDRKFQEWAWEAFQAYMKASRALHGYASVQDVTKPPGFGNQIDISESFWGAETLKYLYLIFCDEDVVSLDEWVFSTEAHPFRIVRDKK